MITLNIYTDAASYNNGQKRQDQPQHTVSAGILTFGGRVLNGCTSFNQNSTNNYGEIYAIYMALKQFIPIIDSRVDIRRVQINLYSDSMISVKGLRDWISGWKGNCYNGCWHNSSGQPVANQHIFEAIDNEFLSNPNYNIRLIHIRGHRDLNKKSSVYKAMSSFKSINGYVITEEEIRTHILFNNIVDKYAGRVLKDCLL